jgi:hypothetical protein
VIMTLSCYDPPTETSENGSFTGPIGSVM